MTRRNTTARLDSFSRSRQLRLESLEDRRLLVVATFVGDLNSTPAGMSEVSQVVSAGEKLFFTASDDANGQELWTTDGTSASSMMLKDIRTGSQGSSPRYLTPIGDSVFFGAADSSGYRLWHSDGTSQGTIQLGNVYVWQGSTTRPFASIGDIIYFAGSSTSLQDFELWRSDGTVNGTFRVQDIYPGQAGSVPGSMYVMNDKLYFAADNGVHGREFWVSDGTSAGTTMLKDIGTATRGASSNPSWLTSMGSILFFNANDGTNGNELWRSDGTTAGTYMVRATPSFTNETGPAYITPINGLLYYSMHDRDHGRELWRSDGTGAGTYLFSDLSPGASSSWPRNLTSALGAMYFSADVGTGHELWRSDFTPSGTALVKDLRPGGDWDCYDMCYYYYHSSDPGYFTEFNGDLYFVARGSEHGRELWKTDGNAEGTVIAADIAPGSTSSYPTSPISFNSKLYFGAAQTGSYLNADLWKSDGTQVGTLRVGRAGTAHSSPRQFTRAGDAVFFLVDDGVHGREIWRTDLSGQNARLALDLAPGAAASNAILVGESHGHLIFSHGGVLHSLDVASNQVEELPASGSGPLYSFGEYSYFSGYDSTNGYELWRTDGTAAGTVLVKDLSPGEYFECDYYGYTCGYTPNSSFPSGFTEYKGELYFSAASGLWTTDGTSEGTSAVPDFPGSPHGLFVSGDYMYFQLYSDYELWRTDGTAAGTLRAINGYDLGLNSMRGWMPFGDGMLFYGDNVNLSRSELWFTRGTSRSSSRLAEFGLGSYGSGVSMWGTDANAFFVRPNTDELWSTNGTVEGTVRVKDGGLSTGPHNGGWIVEPWNDRLVFSAAEARFGAELWVSDGTRAGTGLLVELTEGARSSSPQDLTAIGDSLWLSADDGVLGREPWRLADTAPDTIPPQVSGLFSAGVPVSDQQEFHHVVTDLAIAFSEELGAGISDPANWRLTRHGVDASSQIDSVTFGFNAATSRHEATINFSPPLTGGAYVLTLRDAVTDLAGNALDGDGDGAAGGDYSISFSVVAPLPAGDEFRVNTFTAGDQRGFPTSPGQIAMAADGSFVVTWTSVGQEGTGDEIYLQRYNARGTPVGGEVRANAIAAGNQRNSTIAAAADGSFVVAWNDDHVAANSFDIYARRFDAQGAPLGEEFLVNALNVAGAQRSPVVTASTDGRFAVVWHGPDASSNGIFARLYASDGTPLSDEFPFNTHATGQQQIKSAAMSADGALIVAWQSDGQDGDAGGIYARIFEADGTPRTSEFMAPQTSAGSQQNPSVAVDQAGNFLVTWTSDGQDGDAGGIYARRFNAVGEPHGDEFRVNETTASAQRYSTVAMDADGDAIITWSSFAQDGDADGVFARRYNSAGKPEGHEFRVNTFIAGNQIYSSPALDEDGDFVVVWSSQGQDGDGYGVYGQRYAVPSSAQPGDTDADGDVDLEDLNNVRNHFGAVGEGASGDTFPFDGDVDLDDLNAVRNNFGATSTLSSEFMAKRNAATRTLVRDESAFASRADATQPAETLRSDHVQAAFDHVHAYAAGVWQRCNEALADLEVEAPWHLAIPPHSRRNVRR